MLGASGGPAGTDSQSELSVERNLLRMVTVLVSWMTLL